MPSIRWTAERMRAAVLSEMAIELDNIRNKHDSLFDKTFGMIESESIPKKTDPGDMEELLELAARYSGIVDMMDKVRTIGL